MVFLGNAELKREMPQNVTVGPGGAQYMRLFGAHLLTEAQVTAICEVDRVETLGSVAGDDVSEAC